MKWSEMLQITVLPSVTWRILIRWVSILVSHSLCSNVYGWSFTLYSCKHHASIVMMVSYKEKYVSYGYIEKRQHHIDQFN